MKGSALAAGISAFLLLVFQNIALASSESPVGVWRTIDDVTGQPRSIIEIEQTSEGEVYARVLKVLQIGDEVPGKLCDKCKGRQKDQPIVGMVIMWGMMPHGHLKWGGGKILEPKTGNVYDSKIQLIEEGERLKVRGFKGISLLGRTQIWQRLTHGE